jgi:hypothetical protein
MHSHWFAWFLVDGCVFKVIKSLKTTPTSTSSPSLYLCLVQPNHPLYLFKKKPLNLFLAPARSRNRPPAQLLCWTQTSSHWHNFPSPLSCPLAGGARPSGSSPTSNRSPPPGCAAHRVIPAPSPLSHPFLFLHRAHLECSVEHSSPLPPLPPVTPPLPKLHHHQGSMSVLFQLSLILYLNLVLCKFKLLSV